MPACFCLWLDAYPMRVLLEGTNMRPREAATLPQNLQLSCDYSTHPRLPYVLPHAPPVYIYIHTYIHTYCVELVAAAGAQLCGRTMSKARTLASIVILRP